MSTGRLQEFCSHLAFMDTIIFILDTQAWLALGIITDCSIEEMMKHV